MNQPTHDDREADLRAEAWLRALLGPLAERACSADVQQRRRLAPDGASPTHQADDRLGGEGARHA